MNRELDKRLLELKKSNPSQFRKEMRLQADFNKALKAECGRQYTCDGTAALLNGDGCYEKFTMYRARQAQAINQAALELKPAAKKARSPHWSAEFRSFARSLCSMPASIWKDKAPPPDCENRVLLDMESSDLTPDPDPCSDGNVGKDGDG